MDFWRLESEEQVLGGVGSWTVLVLVGRCPQPRSQNIADLPRGQKGLKEAILDPQPEMFRLLQWGWSATPMSAFCGHTRSLENDYKRLE